MCWALLAVMLQAAPASTAYKVGPVPEWVEPVSLPTTLETNANAVMLLDDVQYRAGRGPRQRYEHRAWKVLTLDGVKEFAQQKFVWEPTYSSLTIHGIWVVRDGLRRDAWSAEDARVLNFESNLDQGIYDGRQTLVVELRDLRAGDVIEYATTVSGENPIFEGHVSFTQFVGTVEPLSLLRLRVLWEGARALQFKAHGGAAEPTATTVGKVTNFRFEARDLKPVRFELGAPHDVPQVPSITFTDWNGWPDVAAWSSRVFKASQPGMRFYAALEGFRKLPEDQRLEKVVRFVQDDVRYVGVETGAHSHLPHSVEWVLERGFGDCKDKAQLLVALLRGLGVDAAPMLVNTAPGMVTADELASPLAFDHVIVKVALPDGPRFIDATQTHRRGRLSKVDPPAFGLGLIADAKSTALEAIPTAQPEFAGYELKQEWTEGVGRPSTLQVIATGRGEDAAMLRRIVVNDEFKERRRQMRADDFDAELELVSIVVSDDELADAVSIIEDYKVKQFWVAGQHEFRSALLARELLPIDEDERKFALRLEYPRRVKETLVWHASEKLSGFNLDQVKDTLPAFEVQTRKSMPVSTSLVIEWELKNLRDRVEPAELKDFNKAKERALHEMAFTVFQVKVSGGDGRGNSVRHEPRTTEENIVLFLFLAGVVGLALFIMSIPKIPGWWKDGKAKWRARKFVEGQKSSPGEVASHPATVANIDEGRAFFTSSSCPRRHAWGEIVKGEGVRLGEDRISVLTRRCTTCDAREDRYLKVTGA